MFSKYESLRKGKGNEYSTTIVVLYLVLTLEFSIGVPIPLWMATQMYSNFVLFYVLILILYLFCFFLRKLAFVEMLCRTLPSIPFPCPGDRGGRVFVCAGGGGGGDRALRPDSPPPKKGSQLRGPPNSYGD